ncbi:P-loop containing nucleoside triphosphate hydrolase protein [Microdochium bolleyi]|uniref:p-loop containing nucleoside triphosphate hydrolase protein n=1 Tax=Microdochium bolleyi TaxID=196109 RepID=A0A136J759_9PEZI|nr:P-loop containing nucleoside triphosphate hydrolase protein [Microdochium bolleyi]
MGRHSFWWQGQFFKLHRKQESVFDDGAASGATTFRDKEDLVISCLWRSPEPIKKLLQHAKDQYYKDHQARTLVKRPFPHNMRRFARNLWQVVANRPVRDMRTVVLDSRQKAQILNDMNEYLHPSTPRWYANRGIPLRRGYLFHGPPGTGKTSLSFALAGVFGLDIHVISLLEPTLTEEDLSTLLGSLPRRCIVLLEDIDTAGLRRPENELERSERASRRPRDGQAGGGRGGRRSGGKKSDEANNNDHDKDKADTNSAVTTASPQDWKVSDLARALKTESANSDSDAKKQGISLSGLLNAIDGVASHEGRVLIMTTNVPEALDEALIRPGRVDLQVAFSSATTRQAEELFLRMYESDEKIGMLARGGQQQQLGSVNGLADDTPLLNGDGGAGSQKTTVNGHGKHEHAASLVETTTQRKPSAGPHEDEGDDEEDHPDVLTESQLASTARAFAAVIPNGQFSPAEIQGFLLKRKKHPLRAVREAQAWVEALVRQKESHSKVLEVQ